jgi:threonine/homoserine/homoserine lactone efflux protein
VNTLLELTLFSLIMALGQFSPGPDMLLLTRSSLHLGARAGCSTALGIATGLALHSAIALSGGVFLLLQAAPMITLITKSLATCYLFYLAWMILQTPKNLGECADPTPTCSHFLRGLTCNILNPKVALILASVCAPFLHENVSPLRPWLLGSVIVVQGAALWIIWAHLLQHNRLKKFYEQYQDRISQGFAAFLALLAILLWRP